VLDVDMPQESGIEFVKRLRCSRDVPVLMLSGLARESDRVNGLNAGADDYLVKPFGPDELIARVNALFRRIPSKPNRLAFGSWLFDRDAMRLTCAGQEVALTSAERALLRVLCENAGITLSRSRLLDLLGDPFGERFERSIDIRVARLRKLLNERSPPQWIRTIRGQGYCFWPDS
jgi:DNA-binding response OmpR family regulator